MANTATVTKESVTKLEDGFYSVSIKIVVNDGAEDIFEQKVSAKYNSNAPNLGAVKAELQSKLVAAWDKFDAEDTLFNAAAFDTMIGQLQTAANAYLSA